MTAPEILSCAVVLAALVIRSAVAELRSPGSARQQWQFLQDGKSVAGGAVISVVLLVIDGVQEHVFWALPTGLLTVFILHRGRGEPPKGVVPLRGRRSNDTDPERRHDVSAAPARMFGVNDRELTSPEARTWTTLGQEEPATNENEESAVRARDLAVEYESVSVDSDATQAARLMAEHKLPALLVLDEDGEPVAILPASQMIKVLVPSYVQEDPTLAAVVDEKHADRLCQALAGRQVGDCLPDKAAPPPIVSPDATALEVAALMAQVRSPLVAVAEDSSPGTRLLGVITASHLLHELLSTA